MIDVTEGFVLEESPKWKLLADVLEEIERDDTKNDSKRKYFLYLLCTLVHADSIVKQPNKQKYCSVAFI